MRELAIEFTGRVLKTRQGITERPLGLLPKRGRTQFKNDELTMMIR